VKHGATTETAERHLGEWRELGKCRDADAELFFHPEGERGGGRDARDRAAQAVCRGCPVRAECETWALETAEPYGVWGGLTEQDRSEILTGSRMASDTRKRHRPDRDRFDRAAIAEAVAEVIDGDPDALRERLNTYERDAAVVLMRETHTAQEVADLLRWQAVNSVYRATSEHHRRARLVAA
jgi:WhiB family transcriptional regulator, redox-sensing transcriptional regulator